MISSPAQRGRGTACGGGGWLALLRRYLPLPARVARHLPRQRGRRKVKGLADVA